MFGRTLLREEFALRRLQHTFENFAALRGFRIGNSHSGDVETALGVPLGEVVFDAQRGLRDESQATPFKVGPQFEYLGHGAKSRPIAIPRNYALVLILYFRAAVV